MSTLIRLATDGDASAIRDIYRPVVEETHISFEMVCPTVDEMKRRINDIQRLFPWLVLEHEGNVLGYAYASKHKDREAYQWSADVAVYIRAGGRRRGVARALYQALFPALRMIGIYNLIAVIALPNAPSISFHESLGFGLIGVYPRIGFKLGEWRDVGHWLLPIRGDELPPKALTPVSELVASSEWPAVLSSSLSGLRLERLDNKAGTPP